jgi:hypothetical protein
MCPCQLSGLLVYYTIYVMFRSIIERTETAIHYNNMQSSHFVKYNYIIGIDGTSCVMDMDM